MIVLAPNNCLKRAYETPCKQIILEFEEKGNHPFTSNKQVSRRNEQSLSLTRALAWIEKKRIHSVEQMGLLTPDVKRQSKSTTEITFFLL